ncbi:M12 family metallo-peptidase [Weeksellaceae bacterium KMM 9724]|uniref:zinc-dependent metalloprotease n=1 Tax=Profundicola chukchiensis TaxID=2961959 RepID=UPI00243E43E0|nr:zinc-dependent metalloprotease family protein [Profundicola chukchiensis]MDG4951452.1 M12 family metallo-peptidase [Profundicola chukchiensis]
MKTRLFMLCLIMSGSIFAQNFWTSTSINQKELKDNKVVVQDQNLYAIDLAALMNHLEGVPERVNYAIESNHTLEFPNIHGKFEKFYVAEASNFAPGLQAQFPNIRSYRGVSTTNPAVSIAFSVSPLGVQSMRVEAGNYTTFTEAVTTDNSVYIVKRKSDKSPEWACTTTPDEEMENELLDRYHNAPEGLDADDQTMRDFRLALSCTGEYAQYFGGTVEGALAGMNATMTRVNSILERDVTVHLTMIENNADVVYTNAATDPYSPASGMSAWNNQLQSTLTSVIGDANYDIGHLFGATGGGGNAGCIGCVCGPRKGSAFTSPYDGQPEGDRFDVDFVVHEIGHQLGANHTFSRYEGTGVNYEPGSGSTIMGYAGITYPHTNVQMYSDDYFHTGSIQQITYNIKNKTCPTETIIANQTPTVDAGGGYTIPVGTPFILSGSGADADGDEITFTWEQVDSSSSAYNDFKVGDPNRSNGPIVRSVPPTTSPVRYIPSFDKVKQGILSTPFESVSNVARSMNFALQVRDNNPAGGQTISERIRIGVTANGGAFRVNSPNSSSSVPTGSELEVTWNVAETTQAPVNTTLVDILLSTDDGDTFTLLAENVDNNGSYTVNIPADAMTENAFIMVKAVDNIFYALSQKFLIGYDVSVTCHDFDAIGLPLDIADGTGSSYGSYAVGTVPVTDVGPVEEIRVSVDITHTYVGDLQIAFNSPSPSNLNFIWNRQCASADNLNLTFADGEPAVDCSETTSGTVAPNVPFSSYEGFQTQGNWLVGVRDGGSGDTGTFNAATISFCKTTTSPMGVNDVNKDNMMVHVYPNPSKGEFNVKMDLATKGVSLGVYDVTGKQILSYKDKEATGTFNHVLNLDSVAQGVYILQIQTGNEIISKKLIVK